MIVRNETWLKIEILTRGVLFTNEALNYAVQMNAKGQNFKYNIPELTQSFRPQELLITYKDGYKTVTSCVSPSIKSNALIIDYKENTLYISNISDFKDLEIDLDFIKRPDYYDKNISNNQSVLTYVSSCGYDELNIIPWMGCDITTTCSFCGVNATVKEKKLDEITAKDIFKDHNKWLLDENQYLSHLGESVKIAMDDDVFSDHAHIIIISGNLHESLLDYQTAFYCKIAEKIKSEISSKSKEGIVAVLTPPKDMKLLEKMKQSGIDIVTFNLEVAQEPYRSKYTKGKLVLGSEYIEQRLIKSVDIFGKGNVWTNFVFGLEPIKGLLEKCESLLIKGIVPSANILHIDKGNRLDVGAPSSKDVIEFSLGLDKLLKHYGHKPYYCQLALRTSLTNEAYDQRIVLLKSSH